MAKFNDFDLDITVAKAKSDADVQITSYSLCTPGCVTGVLMCIGQSATCTCTVVVSSK